MNRRSFIKKITGVLGLLALPVTVLAGKRPQRIYKDDGKLDVISKQSLLASRPFDGTDSYVKINQWVLHAEQADQMTITKSLHDDDTMTVKVWTGLLPRKGLAFWDKVILKHKGKTLFAGYISEHTVKGDRATIVCKDARCLMPSPKRWTFGHQVNYLHALQHKKAN